MSRHRNVRSMNYTDEYDGYDDVYGHSLDDDYCISPSDAAFIYDRDDSKGQQKMGAFLKSDEDIAEEDESDVDKVSELDDMDKAKLNSCIEKIKSVIGEIKISEQELISLVLKHNFEPEKVIDLILSSSRLVSTEKPPTMAKEKDVNILKSRLQSTNKGTLSNTDLSFSSLSSDLILNHSNNTKGNIQFPKLFNDTFNLKVTNQTKEIPIRKFEVPKLFNNSKSLPFESPVKIINSVSSSHSSLSSLVSSHLGNSGRIEVPKLFGEKSSIDNRILNMNPLNKNMAKCSLAPDTSSETENEWHIDLSSAIRSASDTLLFKTKPRFIENEITFPVNFDPITQTIETEKSINFCQMDISNMMLLNSELQNRVSRFGKIICHRFKSKSPKLKLTEKFVNPKFSFSSPSPDDTIIKHLRRK